MRHVEPSTVLAVLPVSPRQLLAFLAVVCFIALSGCSAAGSISLDPVENDTQIATHAAQDLPSAERDSAVRQTLQTAITNGTGIITDQRRPPFPTDQPVIVDGMVYQLNRTTVDQREVPVATIHVDYNVTDSTDSTTPTIAFERLPAVDQQVIKELLNRDVSDQMKDEGYDFGTRAEYESPNDSALIGREVIVVFDDEQYRVKGERDGTQTKYDYRYTATKTATASIYGKTLRDQYLFTLSNLTETERGVLMDARNDTYYADSDDDEAFGKVVDRFRRHEPILTDETRGQWLVRWNGQTYWVRLYYGQFIN